MFLLLPVYNILFEPIENTKFEQIGRGYLTKHARLAIPFSEKCTGCLHPHENAPTSTEFGEALFCGSLKFVATHRKQAKRPQFVILRRSRESHTISHTPRFHFLSLEFSFSPKLRIFGNLPSHEMNPNKPKSLFRNVCERSLQCIVWI